MYKLQDEEAECEKRVYKKNTNVPKYQKEVEEISDSLVSLS